MRRNGNSANIAETKGMFTWIRVAFPFDPGMIFAGESGMQKAIRVKKDNFENPLSMAIFIPGMGQLPVSFGVNVIREA
jgi:hypothetical protein